LRVSYKIIVPAAFVSVSVILMVVIKCYRTDCN